MLNLCADARYGKERDGDLFEGKRTLMLIHAYQSASVAEKAALDEVLRLPREQRTDGHVSSLREAIDRYGSIDHARIVAEVLAGAASHEYSCIYGGLPDSRDKQFIEGLITWVFERNA